MEPVLTVSINKVKLVVWVLGFFQLFGFKILFYYFGALFGLRNMCSRLGSKLLVCRVLYR